MGRTNDDGVLRMAGLYDKWHTEDGQLLHTFTILTTDSSKRLSWCAVQAHLVALFKTNVACLFAAPH